jgi:dolichol-phosphate mannosyltransferase
MDADWSHDPAYLPAMVASLINGADLVIGSRYVKGGGVRNWGILRRLVSRGGSIFARTVLRLSAHDLTGGFKAWRRATLAALPWSSLHSGGYVFQIETTFRASRAGARVVELRSCSSTAAWARARCRAGSSSEALLVVLRLRWDELRGRTARSRG